jgi:hypothetical protein
VVQYIEYQAKTAKHIGSAKDNIELDLLLKRAHVWIGELTFQTTLFPAQILGF